LGRATPAKPAKNASLATWPSGPLDAIALPVSGRGLVIRMAQLPSRIAPGDPERGELDNPDDNERARPAISASTGRHARTVGNHQSCGARASKRPNVVEISKSPKSGGISTCKPTDIGRSGWALARSLNTALV
jgi:hypothetical protein